MLKSDIGDEAFRRSIRNKGDLDNTSKCGCYYCKEIFSPSEITEWCDAGETAICPHCGIDAVIPESPDFKITESMLDEANEEWFPCR